MAVTVTRPYALLPFAAHPAAEDVKRIPPVERMAGSLPLRVQRVSVA